MCELLLELAEGGLGRERWKKRRCGVGVGVYGRLEKWAAGDMKVSYELQDRPGR